MNFNLHTVSGYVVRAAVLLALAALAPNPAHAANPFVEKDTAGAKAVKTGLNGKTGAAVLPPAMPAPQALGEGRMPPGTPSQLSSQAASTMGGATSLGDTQTKGQAQAELLEGLGISSVAGQRILFRVQRGMGSTSASSQGGVSGSGTSLTGGAVPSGGGTATLASQGYALIRAQDRQPFLLGQVSYVPVVDGFTVTLFRHADKEPRLAVWVGEPGPTPSLRLAPNAAEFANPATAPAMPTTAPPAVMPSSAFAAGQGMSGNTSTSSTGTNTTPSNGAAR